MSQKSIRTGRRRLVKRALNVVLVLLIVAAVLPFIVYAAPQLVGGEESYVVLTGSMEPAIGVGSVVIVSDVAPEDIRSGDVITYYKRGQSVPVTHRVVEVADGGSRFITKGDANEDPDPNPVLPNRIVGSVTLVIPLIGYVIEFANTQYGFLALIVLPFGLLVLGELWNLWKAYRSPPARDDEGAEEVIPAIRPVPTEVAEADAASGWIDLATGSKWTQSTPGGEEVDDD